MAGNMINILKGRFKAMTTNTFGLFIIVIDTYTKSIESLNVIASHFSSLYEHDPEQSWDQFESSIKQLKWDGEISATLSNDLQTLFVNSFLSDVVEQFMDCFEAKKFAKAEHLLSSLIEKILADKNLSLQLESSVISKEELVQKRESANEESKKTSTPEPEPANQQSSQAFNVEDGGVILNVNLVLGPVHGIPIYELRAGDQIVVKIAGRTQKEQYFIDLLKAKSENGDILPIKGIVKEIQSLDEGKEFKILIEIGPGVYGVATEQERVKLKRYDPLSDARVINSQQSTTAQTLQPGDGMSGLGTTSGKSGNLLFIWLIGFVTLVLAVLFFIFFI